MGMAIGITRRDLDAAGLRRAARVSSDSDPARRMLALALVLEGRSRTEAARTCGMDRQTLVDWVHRYNAAGLGGLKDRPLPGRAARLTAPQLEQVAGWVRQGPDLAKDGVVRWRRIDLARKVEAELGVKLAERTMGKVLHKLGFSHVSARPRHPKGDEQAQVAHKKTSGHWSGTPSRSMPGTSRSSSGGRMRQGSDSKGR